MFWDIKKRADLYGIPHNLREIPDQDLLKILDDWENIDVKVLTGINSEILRRKFGVSDLQ